MIALCVCLLQPEDGSQEQRAEGAAAASQEAAGRHVVPGLLRLGAQPCPLGGRGGDGGRGRCHGAAG